MSQLRSAAAALSPREEETEGVEEEHEPKSPEENLHKNREEEEEEEETSGKHMAQAFTALLLALKTKHSSERPGMCGNDPAAASSCQMSPVNYSFPHHSPLQLHRAHKYCLENLKEIIWSKCGTCFFKSLIDNFPANNFSVVSIK